MQCLSQTKHKNVLVTILDLQYTDTGLSPFTQYRYEVEAINSFGSSRSTPVIYRTPPGVPTGDINLRVFNVQARSALFSWNAPPIANGLIQRYELSSTNLREQDQPFKHWEGLSLT